MTCLLLVCCLDIRGSTGAFLLLRYFGGIVSHLGVSGCHYTFLSSPHLWLIIGHICALFVSFVDSFID